MSKLKSDSAQVSFDKQAGSQGIKGFLMLTVLLGILLVVCALGNIWLYVRQVQNGYRLAELYEESEKLINVQRKLHLEWSRFQDPNRLEDVGRNQFGLFPPKPEQKIVIR